jgi:ATP-dependent Lhr-like helicase
MAADDGIVLRIPETDQDPPGADLIAFEPDEIEQIVTTEVGGSALFASRFRESAARALLLPRRDPGRRSPLWQQRQRSAQLLEVAARYPSFPIVLETVREVLQDVYDVPALVDLHRRIAQRRIRLVDVSTQRASPFAQSLLFGYVAAFMYEGDSPVAERRAAALTLDQGLLAELLGRAELRELLDADVLAEVESELQRLRHDEAEDRRARDAEGLVDVLRLIGPLTTDELAARSVVPVEESLALLAHARRVVEVRIAGEARWAVVEDVARLRDGLGVPVPPGTPDAFTEPSADPLGDLVGRYARTHGPFTAAEVAARLGLGVAVAHQTLVRLAAQGRVLDGEFRPAGAGTEWCDAEVLRKLRRRSLARLRHEVEPVEQPVLGRFLPAWQGVSTSSTTGGSSIAGGRALRGPGGVLAVVEQLAGCAVPASALESLVLPCRVVDYQPAYLDELTATGEVLWAGHGGLSGADGWVSLHLADSAPLTLPEPGDLEISPDHQAVLDALDGGGAFFFRQLGQQLSSTDDSALAALIWDLVWAGHLGNDTLAPLRGLTRSGRTSHRVRATPPRARVASARVRSPMPTRGGPADMAGRWFRLPEIETDPTRRAHAAAEGLLDRHGVVTRGAVVSERTPGGFAAAYRVLATFEESGRCRRGYFVDGLGAAQFGTAGAIDRLRSHVRASPPDKPEAVTLAATDPANPYGAALPWPASTGSATGATAHRPGRKAGALVVLVEGEVALYVERGGRTLLTFVDDEDVTAVAIDALGTAVRRGALGRLTVEKADGAHILGQDSEPIRRAMEAAGFVATSKGLRLRR